MKDPLKAMPLKPYLEGLIPSNNALRQIFEAFAHFPEAPKEGLSAKKWLATQFLRPNEARLTPKNIAKALSKIFPNNGISEGNLKAFLEEERDVSNTQRFLLGIASILMGSADRENLHFWFDLALSKYHLNPPLQLMSFAKMQVVAKEKNYVSFLKIWNKFEIPNKTTFDQIGLYQNLKALEKTTRQRIYEGIRSALGNYPSYYLLEKPDIDNATIQKSLPRGFDPNKPLKSLLVEREDQASWSLWTERTEREVTRKYLSHLAVEKLDHAFFESLLDFGADLSLKNMYGLDPIQWMLWVHHHSLQNDPALKEQLKQFLGTAQSFGYRPAGSFEQYISARPINPPHLKELEEVLRKEWRSQLSYSDWDQTIQQELNPAKYYHFPLHLELEEEIRTYMQQLFP